MKIAIASGKGGTGKTTLAVNLTKYLENENITLVDCDVEEPNCHLFLEPVAEKTESISSFVPKIDTDRCTVCGKCAEICRFHAILRTREKILIFPELCHACRGCERICPESAVFESKREVGVVETGWAGKIRFIHGRLRIGEAMSPPLIRVVKNRVCNGETDSLCILDAPPGTSCPAVETIKSSDMVVLVTEPTPFGLNDLKLAVEMVRSLDIPLCVAVNRSTIGTRDVWNYCKKENIPVLLEIPFDRKIAEIYSQGKILIDALPEVKKRISQFWEAVNLRLERTKRENR